MKRNCNRIPIKKNIGLKKYSSIIMTEMCVNRMQ